RAAREVNVGVGITRRGQPSRWLPNGTSNEQRSVSRVADVAGALAAGRGVGPPGTPSLRLRAPAPPGRGDPQRKLPTPEGGASALAGGGRGKGERPGDVPDGEGDPAGDRG